MVGAPGSTKLIDDGLAALQAGQFANALTHLEEALRVAPNDPEALHLLGLAYENLGEREKALQSLERAVSIDPNEVAFRVNFSAILERAGKLNDAVTHLHHAAKTVPQDNEICLRLAKLAFSAANFEMSADCFSHLFSAAPGNATIYQGLALSLMRLGRYGDVLKVTQTALDLNPQLNQAYEIGVAAATALRKWALVIQFAEAWRQNSKNTAALKALAGGYFETGEYDNARTAYRQLLKATDNAVENLTSFGRFCLSIQDFAAAETLLKKAYEAAPCDPMVNFALSRLHMFLGDTQQAIKFCEAALDIDPGAVTTIAQFVKLKNGDVGDDILATLKSRLSDDFLSPEHKALAEFAIADVYYNRREARNAIKYYDKANTTSRRAQSAEGLIYNADLNSKLRDSEDRFYHKSDSDWQFAAGPVVPIFIIAMPRSGTTLVESILAAHPSVYGAGEINALPNVHDAIATWSRSTGATSIREASIEQRNQWRDQYFNALPHVDGAKWIVDKQLANIRSIGLMRALIPEARVIYIRRNPVETAFSIYRHNFGKVWSYATDMHDTIHAYGVAELTAKNWIAQAPDAITFCQYEYLVAEFEIEARRLVAHCGIDWRDECLEFHNSNRPVATFSALQVRNPVQKKKIASTELYGFALDPLLKTINDVGLDPETGAMES